VATFFIDSVVLLSWDIDSSAVFALVPNLNFLGNWLDLICFCLDEVKGDSSVREWQLDAIALAAISVHIVIVPAVLAKCSLQHHIPVNFNWWEEVIDLDIFSDS
jgi:hypothetical protein